MKSNTLIQLPTFSYTSLDFDTIIADVQNLITEHPEYLVNWDDFTESDAGKMLIEMMSFIVEKMSSKLDWVARELFLSTATQQQSMIDILALINYVPTPPIASCVNATLTLTTWVPSYTLPPLLQISAPDTTGNNITFECIQMESDGKPNYSYIQTIDTGTTTNSNTAIANVPFYQGYTVTENDIWMEGISNESFTLTTAPVINNTIRITSITTGKEYIQVESFISPEAQQQGVPSNLQTIPYMVNYDSSYNATIQFGNSSLVSTPINGEHIMAQYRVGGGRTTNITAGSMSQTRSFTVNGTRVTGIFSNPNAGFGGADAESISDAKITAPLTLRTANKTVTIQDYIIQLEDISTVLHAAIACADNEPVDIFNEYGYSLPPLDTWIYVCPVREGANDADPLTYNQILQLSEDFQRQGWADYEDFVFDSTHQTVFLQKIRPYKYWTKVLVLIDNTTGLAASSFVEGTDYTINYIQKTITRVSTANGGTIDAASHTLRMLYTNIDSAADFKTNCVFTITGGQAMLGSNPFTALYPAVPINVYNPLLSTQYILGTDYTINYTTKMLTIIPTGALGEGNVVICSYADNYNPSGGSEVATILSDISNMKMLCIDNYIKPSRFGVFDVAATVYCYKSQQGVVENGLASTIQEQFTLEAGLYGYPINMAEIYGTIMNFPGVQFVEITYLGRDYETYYQFILGNVTQATLTAMNADTNAHKIVPKYNEIMVMAQNEWDGSEQIQNQRHGLILNFTTGSN